MSDLRLAFLSTGALCDLGPHTNSYRGAWIDTVNDIAKARNWTTSYVVPSKALVWTIYKTRLLESWKMVKQTLLYILSSII
jgi:hypothetical protein